MTWLTAALSILDTLLTYLGRKQLLDAGAAQARAEGQAGQLRNAEVRHATDDRIAAADPAELGRLRDRWTRD